MYAGEIVSNAARKSHRETVVLEIRRKVHRIVGLTVAATNGKEAAFDVEVEHHSDAGD